jgi:hypothetical protein
MKRQWYCAIYELYMWTGSPGGRQQATVGHDPRVTGLRLIHVGKSIKNMISHRKASESSFNPWGMMQIFVRFLKMPRDLVTGYLQIAWMPTLRLREMVEVWVNQAWRLVLSTPPRQLFISILYSQQTNPTRGKCDAVCSHFRLFGANPCRRLLVKERKDINNRKQRWADRNNVDQLLRNPI